MDVCYLHIQDKTHSHISHWHILDMDIHTPAFFQHGWLCYNLLFVLTVSTTLCTHNVHTSKPTHSHSHTQFSLTTTASNALATLRKVVLEKGFHTASNNVVILTQLYSHNQNQTIPPLFTDPPAHSPDSLYLNTSQLKSIAEELSSHHRQTCSDLWSVLTPRHDSYYSTAA